MLNFKTLCSGYIYRRKCLNDKSLNHKMGQEKCSPPPLKKKGKIFGILNDILSTILKNS